MQTNTEVRIADQTFAPLLASLAAKSPAPGGGAAACMIGATACALAGMVVAYSIGKKAHAGDQPMLESAADRLGQMRARFLDLADADAVAYARLNALQKMPADDPVRITEEPAALERAVDAPEQARIAAMDLLGIVESLVGRTNRYLTSDLAIAGIAAEAAAAAAAWNVRVNAPGLPEARRADLFRGIDEGDSEASAARIRIEDACRA